MILAANKSPEFSYCVFLTSVDCFDSEMQWSKSCDLRFPICRRHVSTVALINTRDKKYC